jgi:hypothetical protein
MACTHRITTAATCRDGGVVVDDIAYRVSPQLHRKPLLCGSGTVDEIGQAVP